MTPQPETTGQKVARYLPIALGVLGLLLMVSFVVKNWALFTMLAILLGGGGFAFLYLRASAQGRKDARATTRAITIATAAAAPPPPQPKSTLVLDDRDAVLAEPAAPAVSPRSRETLILDDRDDVPELPLPDDPAQALGAATAVAIEVVPASVDAAPTEVVPAEPVRSGGEKLIENHQDAETPRFG